jgi:hypothetical protein
VPLSYLSKLLISFLADGFFLTKNPIIMPIIKPVTAERNITIARDASNLQKKKEIITGTAF